MNYIQQLKSPRRRLTIGAAVVVLHIFMIYGWFNLKLYGNPHRALMLIPVSIVQDVATPHHAHARAHPH